MGLSKVVIKCFIGNNIILLILFSIVQNLACNIGKSRVKNSLEKLHE